MCTHVHNQFPSASLHPPLTALIEYPFPSGHTAGSNGTLTQEGRPTIFLRIERCHPTTQVIPLLVYMSA
jgi:hypothetical protein